jgi:hypothetical protein
MLREYLLFFIFILQTAEPSVLLAPLLSRIINRHNVACKHNQSFFFSHNYPGFVPGIGLLHMRYLCQGQDMKA